MSCRYGVAVHDLLGRCVLRLFSPKDSFQTKTGEIRTVEIIFNPLQLGPGEYVIGLSVSEYTPLEQINMAKRYDLLSRSFAFSVEIPDSLSAASADFLHSCEWTFTSL